MAAYTIRFSGRAAVTDHDREGVDVIIERDGEVFQRGQVVIDTPRLTTIYCDRVAEPAFWSDVARAGAPLFEAAIRRGDLPTEPLTMPYDVMPRYLPATGDVLDDGDLVGAFEA